MGLNTSTWKSPDGVIHSIGEWGVLCGHRMFRRATTTPRERIVTCIACIAVFMRTDDNESEDDDG